MNIEELRKYCIEKPAVSEHFPFDDDALVFKVAGKMFLLTSLKGWEQNEAAINLKCNPDYAIELRANYESVEPGYHSNKKHWNTMRLYKGELEIPLVKKLIDHSYQLVVSGLTKKQREQFMET